MCSVFPVPLVLTGKPIAVFSQMGCEFTVSHSHHAGRRTDFRDKNRELFSGELFSGEEFLPISKYPKNLFTPKNLVRSFAHHFSKIWFVVLLITFLFLLGLAIDANLVALSENDEESRDRLCNLATRHAGNGVDIRDIGFP